LLDYGLSNTTFEPFNHMFHLVVGGHEGWNEFFAKKKRVFVKLPHERKIVKCKCVYKIKYKIDGGIDKYKVQLVVKGYFNSSSLFKKLILMKLMPHVFYSCNKGLKNGTIWCEDCFCTWRFKKVDLHGLTMWLCTWRRISL